MMAFLCFLGGAVVAWILGWNKGFNDGWGKGFESHVCADRRDKLERLGRK